MKRVIPPSLAALLIVVFGLTSTEGQASNDVLTYHNDIYRSRVYALSEPQLLTAGWLVRIEPEEQFTGHYALLILARRGRDNSLARRIHVVKQDQRDIAGNLAWISGVDATEWPMRRRDHALIQNKSG
jgi:hypothetical protein